MRNSIFYTGNPEWLSNRKKGLCICGKSKKKPYGRYCCRACKIAYGSAWVHWRQLRDQVFDVQGLVCASCHIMPEEGLPEKESRANYQIDHVRAITNGGSPHDIRNLQVLCKKCHN